MAEGIILSIGVQTCIALYTIQKLQIQYLQPQTGMPLRLAQAYILDTPVVESLVPQYPEFSASGGWGVSFQDSKSESWSHAAASVW